MKSLVYIFTLLFCLSMRAYSQTKFSGEAIRSHLMEEIRLRVGDDAEIVVSQSIQDLFFPEKDVTYLFDFESGNSKILCGNFIVGVEFRFGTKLLRRIEVPARVRIYRDLLVATKTIRQGEIISTDNTTISRKEVPPYVSEEEINPEQLVGRPAFYSIVRGSVITRKMVSENLAIRRGERVRILVILGGISIATNGTALQDARAGETIRCLRDGSRSVLTGLASKDGSIVIIN